MPFSHQIIPATRRPTILGAFIRLWSGLTALPSDCLRQERDHHGVSGTAALDADLIKLGATKSGSFTEIQAGWKPGWLSCAGTAFEVQYKDSNFPRLPSEEKVRKRDRLPCWLKDVITGAKRDRIFFNVDRSDESVARYVTDRWALTAEGDEWGPKAFLRELHLTGHQYQVSGADGSMDTRWHFELYLVFDNPQEIEKMDLHFEGHRVIRQAVIGDDNLAHYKMIKSLGRNFTRAAVYDELTKWIQTPSHRFKTTSTHQSSDYHCLVFAQGFAEYLAGIATGRAVTMEKAEASSRRTATALESKVKKPEDLPSTIGTNPKWVKV